MFSSQVALYIGDIDSLRKVSSASCWSDGYLSMIPLPPSENHVGAIKLAPIKYNESSNNNCHLDYCMGYGLLFSLSPVPHAQSAKSSSIPALGNRTHHEPDHVYDELPLTSNTRQDNFFTRHMLKHSKYKVKQKSVTGTVPSPVSLNDFSLESQSSKSATVKPHVILPINVSDEEKTSFFMSSVQCPPKSLKAGASYPFWVKGIIIFRGHFLSSSIVQMQQAQHQSTKMSLKQKLFGGSLKRRSVQDLSGKTDISHVFPESTSPLILGFSSMDIAQLWWQRVQDILTHRKSKSTLSGYSTPFLSTQINCDTKNVKQSRKLSRNHDVCENLEDSYASLPPRIGGSNESLHSYNEIRTLSLSEIIQRARLSKKAVIPRAVVEDKTVNIDRNIFFTAKLLNSSTLEEVPVSSKFSIFPLPPTFSIQIVAPYGLRLVIECDRDYLYFDILITSISRYGFYENVFIIELVEQCTLSPHKELLLQVEEIRMFKNVFTKLLDQSLWSVQRTQRLSDEYSTTSSLRKLPKPQLSQVMHRSSSMSDDIYNPDNNVYAEVNHPKKPTPHSNDTAVDDVEDPYNEGDVNVFL